MTAKSGLFGMGPAGAAVLVVVVVSMLGLGGREVYQRVQETELAEATPGGDTPRAETAPEQVEMAVAPVDEPAEPLTEPPTDAAVEDPEDAAAEAVVEAVVEAAVKPDADPGPEPETPSLSAPSFDVVRIEPDGSGVIAGAGGPESRVTLYLDEAELAQAVVDGAGKFAVFVFLDPSDRPRVLTMKAALDGVEVWSEDQLILAPVQIPAPEAKAAAVAEASTAEAAGSTRADEIAAEQAPAVTAAVDAAPTKTPVATSPADPEGQAAETSAGAGGGQAASQAEAPVSASAPEAAGIPDASVATSLADSAAQEAEPAAKPAPEQSTPVQVAGDGEGAPTPDTVAVADAASDGEGETTGPKNGPETGPETEPETETVAAARDEDPSAGVETGDDTGLADPEPTELADASQPVSDTAPEVLAAAPETPAADAPQPAPTTPGAELPAPEIAAGPAETPRAEDPGPEPGADDQTAPRPEPEVSPAVPNAPEAPSAPAEEPRDFAAAPDTSAAPGAVAVLRAGADGVELLQPGTPVKPDALDRLALDTISYSEAGEVLLSGRAPEGTAVRVYLDNRAVADLPIAADGRWKGEVRNVRPGVYTLRLDQVATDGSVGGRIETPFKREAPSVLRAARADLPPDAPSITAVTVQKGDTLWAISRERYGDGFLYVRVFEANRDAIRNPDLIYPGQVFAIPN